MHNLYRIGFFALCYAVGICAQAVPLPLPSLNGTNQGDSHQNHETFKLEILCNATASDGTALGCRTYRGSNGTIVRLMYGSFDSPEKAEVQLRRVLKSAKKLIQHKAKRTPSGQVTGDRAVASYKTDDRDLYIVVWTNGPHYCYVEAASLAPALQFEYRINAGVALDDLALDPVDKPEVDKPK